MKEILLNQSDKDIKFIENFLSKPENRKLILEARRLFGIPETGLNVTKVLDKNIHNRFYKDGFLLSKYFLNDEVKEIYKEVLMELGALTKKITIEILLDENTLSKVLKVYVFYNKIFIYSDIVTQPENIEVIEVPKNKLSPIYTSTSSSMNVQEFVENVLGGKAKDMTEKEIKESYDYHVHFFNFAFSGWLKDQSTEL